MDSGERGESGQLSAGVRTVAISVLGAILSGAVVQLVAAIWWGAGVMFRLEQAELRGRENLLAISRLEERGFRGIPVIEQQIKELQDRSSRIVQALDASYNALQEHLRIGTELQRIIVLEERIRELGEQYKNINDKLTALEGKLADHLWGQFGQHREREAPPIHQPPIRLRK